MFARTALTAKQATRPACAACRSFSVAIPRPAPGPSSPAKQNTREGQQQRTKQGGSTEALLSILENTTEAPEEVENPAAILRHLSRNQVISPQHLSPRNLLVPYVAQPNFSRAFPLGPPTSYGPTHDPFVRYGIDPLKASNGVLNPWIASEFVTSMGKIKARGKTGLQRKSQRKIGKAIRRARSMGVVPTFGVSLPTGSGY
ncbi:hypothetical protein JCM10207_000693 [Rhodosporidiobolus poonsookiae]